MSLLSGWEAGCKLLRIKFKSTGQYFRFFSTVHGRSSPSLNVNPQELIKEKGDVFYVVRKGNHVGLYRSLSDCQSQVSSSICDPPVSVYKGYLLKKEAEKYLASRGLKNAVYSLNAKDLKEDIFGILVPCPFQEPTVASSVADLPEKISVIIDEPVKEHLKLKHSSEQKQLSDKSICKRSSKGDEPVKKHLKLKYSSKQKQQSDKSICNRSSKGDEPVKKHLKLKSSSEQKQLSDSSISNRSSKGDEPVKEHPKLKYSSEQKQLSDNSMSCTLEFYGTSAGEAGKGGAGVILRTEDGSVISRLSEGLGAVTTEAAHYRALILGLKQAHKKGFKQIQVQSDSQLICMQMQGLRKAEKLVELCDEAKALKEMFASFGISHVKKSKNSDARDQAAIATDLPVGEVHEDSVETC